MTGHPCPWLHWTPAFVPSYSEFVFPGFWYVDNRATSVMDSALLQHGGLPNSKTFSLFMGFELVGTGLGGFIKELGLGLDYSWFSF